MKENKIEATLRQIHLLFAKCTAYNGSQDEIVVSKKEVFELLEELNYDVLDIMDNYDATNVKLEQRQIEAKRSGEEIVANAKKSAEDVYAASLLYSDTVLKNLTEYINDTELELKRSYDVFIKRLNGQVDTITKNNDEIHDQLNAMAQGEKYLEIIDRENDRRKHIAEFLKKNNKKDYNAEDESFDDEDYDEDGDDEASTAAEENAGAKSAEDGNVVDIDIRKSEKEGTSGKGPSNSNGQVHKVSDRKKKKKVRKIGMALYEDVGRPFDDTAKAVPKYEIKVNESFLSGAEAKSGEELDYEYEKWLNEGNNEDSGEKSQSGDAAKAQPANPEQSMKDGKSTVTNTESQEEEKQGKKEEIKGYDPKKHGKHKKAGNGFFSKWQGN